MNESTKPDFINRNGQVVLRKTGYPGTDNLQYIYELRCSHCEIRYGANGSDIHERLCPNCQGGRPGLEVTKVEEIIMASSELIQEAKQAWSGYGEAINKAFNFPQGSAIVAEGLDQFLASATEDHVHRFVDWLREETNKIATMKFVGDD